MFLADPSMSGPPMILEKGSGLWLKRHIDILFLPDFLGKKKVYYMPLEQFPETLNGYLFLFFNNFYHLWLFYWSKLLTLLF